MFQWSYVSQVIFSMLIIESPSIFGDACLNRTEKFCLVLERFFFSCDVVAEFALKLICTI